jgi:WD40 repeat protein
MTKEQSHASSIYAIASYGNQFYSTSSKSLKIWNLETMSVVSDIGAHQSYIRCLAVWPERNLLLTASSDKTIILWDQISLTQVATIRGHKEEIRALAVQPESNGKLFSAGKGTQ